MSVTQITSEERLPSTIEALGQLVIYGAQRMYLTATLPPRDETKSRELMHMIKL